MSILRIILAGLTALSALVLATPVIVLGFPFIVVSYCVGLLASRLEPRTIQWPELFEFDARLGWKVRANVDCYCLDERDDVFHIITDPQGWPGIQTIENSDMVVIGDSHAFGYGVDHKNSFSQQTRGVRTKAIGVPGYNMVQELMILEELAPKLRHKLIVWFCYVGNDLFDNLAPEMLGYRAPFLRQSHGRIDWEVVTSHLAPEPWRCSIGQSALRRSGYPLIPGLHSDTVLSRRVYPACEHLIDRGHQVCRKNGARLVLVGIPEPFALDQRQIAAARERYPFLKNLDPDYPDQKLRAMCNKVGVRYTALKDHLEFSDFKRSHDHWTERGHRRVAKVLSRLYREHVSGADRERKADSLLLQRPSTL